ncbi:hypothetical protein CC80DRAFT_141785 [Byssothecium circinans]|uniref:CorA-like transporter domain-containing protein n=1 Tax=Byssothecium circinans TaxID=147558 RepID=A0A6A5TX96_9PLEO|nr:hypothetical protein CC80DRAFT_141785 [Byssothecium circinans]
MESLIQSCKNFEQYPQNVIQHDALRHTLKAQSERLDSQEHRLFNDRQAAVDLLSCRYAGEEFSSKCVTSLNELKEELREAWRPGQSDPQCRYIFLHSPNSRAPLRISRNMLSFLFTYHQVTPSFLDFIFPFCKQVNAQDFHFSGLRDESRLDAQRRGPEIQQLNRSGNELRICYNLRSVERAGSIAQPVLPSSVLNWSIRQSAIYHSFDLKTGQALWINVKGNKLIKTRITEATSSPSPLKAPTRSEAFSASLDTHLIMCDWSGENWRWYINDLEDDFRRLTRDALVISVDRTPSPVLSAISLAMSPRVQTGEFSPISRTGTTRSPRQKFTSASPVQPSRTTTLVDLWPTADTANSTQNCYEQKNCPRTGFMGANRLKHDIISIFSRLTKLQSGSFWRRDNLNEDISSSFEKEPARVPAPGNRMKPEDLPTTFSDDGEEKPQETFTFSDLQRLQHIEDKTQEALLVLRHNTEVLQQLRHHYQYATSHTEFPADIKSDCATDLARFDKCVLGVEKDLLMLHSRTETLLQLLANRKSLLNGILQTRSVKANEFFAKKAHQSAHHMEMMTLEMHAIAKKTEQETVSMRVITTVTLFFLPATFIAVRAFFTTARSFELNELQTFMSTDILGYKDGHRDFQLDALHIYLSIALPLTALTFFVWWVISRLARKTGQPDGAPSHSDAV